MGQTDSRPQVRKPPVDVEYEYRYNGVGQYVIVEKQAPKKEGYEFWNTVDPRVKPSMDPFRAEYLRDKKPQPTLYDSQSSFRYAPSAHAIPYAPQQQQYYVSNYPAQPQYPHPQPQPQYPPPQPYVMPHPSYTLPQPIGPVPQPAVQPHFGAPMSPAHYGATPQQIYWPQAPPSG